MEQYCMAAINSLLADHGRDGRRWQHENGCNRSASSTILRDETVVWKVDDGVISCIDREMKMRLVDEIAFIHIEQERRDCDV